MSFPDASSMARRTPSEPGTSGIGARAEASGNLDEAEVERGGGASLGTASDPSPPERLQPLPLTTFLAAPGPEGGGVAAAGGNSPPSALFGEPSSPGEDSLFYAGREAAKGKPATVAGPRGVEATKARKASPGPGLVLAVLAARAREAGGGPATLAGGGAPGGWHGGPGGAPTKLGRPGRPASGRRSVGRCVLRLLAALAALLLLSAALDARGRGPLARNRLPAASGPRGVLGGLLGLGRRGGAGGAASGACWGCIEPGRVGTPASGGASNLRPLTSTWETRDALIAEMRAATRAAAGPQEDGWDVDAVYEASRLEAGKLLARWPEGKPKAAFFVLARNSDLAGVLSSVADLEARFNGRPGRGYPYVIVNDRDFTPEFVREVSNSTTSPTLFGRVPEAHFSPPAGLDRAVVEDSLRMLSRTPHGGSLSYRLMCRYFSGFFFDHPLLDGFEYYWRVEPDVSFYCDLDDDPFVTAARTGTMYGFNMIVGEIMETIPSLWATVAQHLAAHPEDLADGATLPALLHPRPASREALLAAAARGAPPPSYLGYHFWSNFEIGALRFFRSPEYRRFFEHLERAGGFFYERWGDAPVHTLAAASLLDAGQIRFFDEVAYRHDSWVHCPSRQRPGQCSCSPERDENSHGQRAPFVAFMEYREEIVANATRRARASGQAGRAPVSPGGPLGRAP